MIMIKKYLILILITFFFNSTSFSASEISDSSTTTEEPNGPSNTSNYDKAVKIVNKGNKYDKKNKKKKAQKFYQKAFKLLQISNKDFPANPDTLNYLGYTSRKLGDFENAEIYYLLGLEIDPEHNDINEYLGELYVNTGRLAEAKERLKILENCNCEEFKELDNAIKFGSSKY
jgi:tetratricopeptide (TPR) repeat protein